MPDAPATILFAGDLVGSAGRRALLGLLPELRRRYEPTFVVANAENAKDMTAAAYILFQGMLDGTFTKKKLSDYFNDDKTDWLNARRIVNGTDKAHEIANIAKMFYADLLLAQEGATA